MRRSVLPITLLVLAPLCASAQTSSGIQDVTAIAAQAVAAQSDAQRAQAAMAVLAAQVSALSGKVSSSLSAIPAPCDAVPVPDTLMGGIGSGNCFARAADSRPTSVQAGIVTTDVTGSWSISWAKPFATTTPFLIPQPINAVGAQPMTCNVMTSTATQASGRCWVQSLMNTPGLGISLNGLQIVGTAAGVQVRIAGRDLTQ